jgi:hypothetical protein
VVPKLKTPCLIDFERTDEQREYDFDLIVNGQRLSFQTASDHDAGRRLETTIAGAARNSLTR